VRYIFQCNNCAKQYEVGLKLEDSEKEVKCPRCKRQMKKVIQKLRFKIK
jgi:putative FmdB family regulatory protein